MNRFLAPGIRALSWMQLGAYTALAGGVLLEVVRRQPVMPGNPLFALAAVCATAYGGLRAGCAVIGLILGWRWLAAALLSDHAAVFSLPDLVLGVGAGALIVLGTAAVRAQYAREATAARQARGTLSAFLDSAPFGVFAVDKGGVPLYYNQAALQLLGQSSEPGATSGFARTYTLHAPGEATPYPPTEMPIRRALKGELGYDELEVERPDGARRLLGLHTRPVFSQQGDVDYALAMFEDISDRRRIEDALTETSERLRTTFQAALSGLLLHDARGVVIDANPAALNILRVSLDDLRGSGQGTGGWNILQEDGSPLAPVDYPHMTALRLGARVPGVVIGVGRPDTTVRWVLVTVEPLLAPDGRTVTGAVTSFTDVTQQRMAERQLQATAQQLASVIHDSPLAIYRMTYGTRIVSLWNPAAEAMFGWTADEVLGQRLPTIPDDQEATAVAESQRLQAEGGPLPHLDAFRLRKDGTRIAVRLSAANVGNASGGQDEMLVFALDVTERGHERAELAAILQESPVAIYAVAGDTGLVTRWNPAAERVYGWSAAEVLGRQLPLIPMGELGPRELLLARLQAAGGSLTGVGWFASARTAHYAT